MNTMKHIIFFITFLFVGPGLSQNSDSLVTLDGVMVDYRQNGFPGQSIRLWITTLPSSFDIIDENSEFTLTFPQGVVGVEKRPGGHIPKVFNLTPTWPNPGNSVIRWDYSMPWSTQVSATIYDVLGREVGEVFDQHQTPGRYTASFDATGLPAGVYFAMVRANGAYSVQKFTVQSQGMALAQDPASAATYAGYASFNPNGRVLSTGALSKEYFENRTSDILIAYDNTNGFRVVQPGSTLVDIIQFLAKSGGSISIKGNALARFDGVPQEPVPVFAGQDTTIMISGVYDDQPFDLENLVLDYNDVTVQNVSYADNAMALQVRVNGENPSITGRYTDPLGGEQNFSLDFAVQQNIFSSPYVTLPEILEDTPEDSDTLFDLTSLLADGIDPEGLTYKVRSSSLDVGGKVLPNTSLLQYFTRDGDFNGPATLTIEAYRNGTKVGQTTAEMEVKPQTDNYGTVFSVGTDSGKTITPIEDALVVFLDDSMRTGPDGQFHFQNEPGDPAVLYVFADGHHERNELIGTHRDHQRDQYVPTEEVPIGYIYETRMQGGNYPLRFPTETDQGIYLVNPPNDLWKPYIETIIAEDMPLGSNGDIRGHLADSSEAFGKIKWRPFTPGVPDGSVDIHYNPDDQTEITGWTIALGEWLDGSDPHMRGITLKELIGSLYGGGDTMLEQYKGLALHIPKDFPIQEVPQGDIDAGRFISKIGKQDVPGGWWGNYTDILPGDQRRIRDLVLRNYHPGN